MSALSQLLSPEVFARLDEKELSRLGALIDAEIVSNPEIRKLLQSRIDKLLPHISKKTPGKTPGRK